VNALQQLNFGDGLVGVHCNLDNLTPPAAQALTHSSQPNLSGSLPRSRS
jgi:hypothetical protein